MRHCICIAHCQILDFTDVGQVLPVVACFLPFKCPVVSGERMVSKTMPAASDYLPFKWPVVSGERMVNWTLPAAFYFLP